jgi:glycosyltransferase involved in cell wall biosynthesis
VLVTIVTPSLNGIEFLAECIDSTRRQQTRNVEVEHIFVDGGSTDGTVEFASAEGCKVLTREEDNLYVALNKGARNSGGALLGSIGCDDILLPGALDAVVRHYQKTGASWLVGGCRLISERGASRGSYRAPPRWLSVPMLASLGWNCFPNISTFVERELYFQYGGYDERFEYAADYDLYARMLAELSFDRITRPLTGVRLHRSNWSRSPDPRRLAEDRSVAQRYGPASPWQQAGYRYLMKLWLNGSNPNWFVHKRLDELADRRRPRSSDGR